MKNCDELRKELAQTFAQLKAVELALAEAQVEYYALRKERPRIDWLESPNVEVTSRPVDQGESR